MKQSEANCSGCATLGTPEQQAKLHEVIDASKDTPGCLMHILQEAQAIYGYLPMSVQKVIAEELGESVEAIRIKSVRKVS